MPRPRPSFAEAEPTLGQPAPDDIKAEVQAAIAAATEASESVEQTVDEATPKPSAEGDAPAAPQVEVAGNSDGVVVLGRFA